MGTATASAKATSLTVNLPVGTQAGDQVVVATTEPSTTTVTAPSGYTKVTSVTSGGAAPLAMTTVFRHTVVSGDTSVKLTYSVSSTAQSVVVAVYQGVDPNLPIDVSAKGSSAASKTVTGPSVTPAYANDRLLVIQGATGTFSGETWTAPTGTTEEAQVNATANASTGLADQFLGAPVATGARVSTYGARANLTSVVIALAQPPSVLYLHQDQLGSTRMLTDGAGVVRATFTYSPYGTLTASTGSSTTPFLFSGQYQDAESGFYYLRARYYDPTTAQFLTVDPKVATTLSPYGYVAGDPINLMDASGKWFGIDDILATVGGTLIGGGVSALSQWVTTGKVNWGKVGVDALSGAIGGEASLYLSPFVGGAISGGVDDALTQLYENGGTDNFDWWEVGANGLAGAALGGGGDYAFNNVAALNPATWGDSGYGAAMGLVRWGGGDLTSGGLSAAFGAPWAAGLNTVYSIGIAELLQCLDGG